MTINKEEAKFILETVLNAPVQTDIQSIVKGLSATPIVTNLIEKLKAELEEKPPVEPVTDFDQPYNV